MAVYVVGDIQGCLDPLKRLLEKLKFDPSADYLWCVGDLINRGPKSLQTLEFFRDLGERAVAVLGNHDLNFLAVSQGLRKPKHQDTLDDILNSPHLEELVNWLRHLPLIHVDQALGYVMVHAGLPAYWDLPTAVTQANQVEEALRSDDFVDFLKVMYGDQPDLWRADLNRTEQMRFTVNALTRMRYCHADGRLELHSKGHPSHSNTDLIPWYQVKRTDPLPCKIVFGHWSTLKSTGNPRIHALDTGCVWGGHLTAMRLPDEAITQMPCPASKTPG